MFAQRFAILLFPLKQMMQQGCIGFLLDARRLLAVVLLFSITTQVLKRLLESFMMAQLILNILSPVSKIHLVICTFLFEYNFISFDLRRISIVYYAEMGYHCGPSHAAIIFPSSFTPPVLFNSNNINCRVGLSSWWLTVYLWTRKAIRWSLARRIRRASSECVYSASSSPFYADWNVNRGHT